MKTPIKNIVILLFTVTTFCHAQKKETIYIKFRDSIDKKYFNYKNVIDNRIEKIFFALGKYPDKMALAFRDSANPDTLAVSALKKFKFDDAHSIEGKVWDRNKKKFGGQPPFTDRNYYFNTYLVEEIPNSKIVVYPVVWIYQGFTH